MSDRPGSSGGESSGGKPSGGRSSLSAKGFDPSVAEEDELADSGTPRHPGAAWADGFQMVSQIVMVKISTRGKSRGGMIIRFPEGRESDSFWECRRLPILTAFRTLT